MLAWITHIYAHTVTLKPVHEKMLDTIQNIVLWHYAAFTSVDCHTGQCLGHIVELHPHSIRSEIISNRVCGIWFCVVEGTYVISK